MDETSEHPEQFDDDEPIDAVDDSPDGASGEERADELDEDTEPDDDAELDDDTEHATVAGGATVDEAKRKALEQLRKVVPYVRESDVEFVVLNEGGRGGFLGMGKSHPRVEARVLPSHDEAPVGPSAAEALAKLHEFVTTVADGIGLDVEVEVTEDGDTLIADVVGDDLGLLIGRHGQTLDALQYLAAIVVNGHGRTRRQIVVDAEGYRGRREISLGGVADRAAQRAERTHGAVDLKPMTAAERKIVHLRLKDHPRVETHSEGDEPQRYVVVSFRRRQTPRRIPGSG